MVMVVRVGGGFGGEEGKQHKRKEESLQRGSHFSV